VDLIAFAYYLLTLSAGVFCLGGLFVLMFRQKNEVLRHYFIFYSAFSIFMMMTVIRTFVLDTGASDDTMTIMTHLQLLTVFLTLFLFVSLVNRVLIVPAGKIVNIVLLGCTILAYLFGLQENDAFRAGTDEIFDILLLLYCLIIYLIYRKNIKNSVLRKSMRYTFFCILLFIPGLILDEIVFAHGSKLHIVPVFYIAIGILTFFGFRAWETSLANAGTATPVKTAVEFGFTERETEVMELLLRGYSYIRIAETLIISISTVRTHVTSIYKKSSVNSRYELMNLFP